MVCIAGLQYNHLKGDKMNQEDSQNNDNQTEQLVAQNTDLSEDLPVSDEQGVAVKGGAGGGYGMLLYDTTSSMNTVR
jgi:hypothetical protein